MTNAEILRGLADAEPRLSRGDVSLIKEVADKIERLEAIVDKLPMWANTLVDAHNQLHGIPRTRMAGQNIGYVEKELRKAAEAGGKLDENIR